MGHATRSVAVIRALQKLKIKTVVRNSNVADFLEKSLPGITIIRGLTDMGPSIKRDGISVDVNKSRKKIVDWIDQMEKISLKESDLINKLNPDLIISDISAMPLLAAKKTDTKSIAISNFSWYDTLNFLPTEKLEKLRSYYENSDLCIQLPLGTAMKNFKNKKKVGFVARNPIKNRSQIRAELGIKNSEYCVLFALGKSQNEVACNKEKNIKILAMSTKVKKSLNSTDLSDWREGQELVSASDLVICKCGYGLISECLTNGIPFYYIFDGNHPEQMAMSRELFKLAQGKKITFEEINELNLSTNLSKEFSSINKEPIDTKNTINYILEFLRN